jgi:hypothetical protein
MKQIAAVVLVGLFGAGLVRADSLLPGTRNLPIDYRIETDKDYPDLVFFTIRGSGSVTSVQFDQKTPLTIPGSNAEGKGPVLPPGEKLNRPYRSTSLVAVPKEAAGSYPTEKAFHAALDAGTVPGLAKSQPLYDHRNVPTGDPRKSIVRVFRVEKIDPKEGIVLTELKNAEGSEGEGGREATTGPGVQLWMVGLAGSLAVVLAGVWLVRRRRARQTG